MFYKQFNIFLVLASAIKARVERGHNAYILYGKKSNFSLLTADIAVYMENSNKSIRITKLEKLLSTARLTDKNCVLYTLAANKTSK